MAQPVFIPCWLVSQHSQDRRIKLNGCRHRLHLSDVVVSALERGLLSHGLLPLSSPHPGKAILSAVLCLELVYVYKTNGVFSSLSPPQRLLFDYMCYPWDAVFLKIRQVGRLCEPVCVWHSRGDRPVDIEHAGVFQIEDNGTAADVLAAWGFDPGSPLMALVRYPPKDQKFPLCM